MQKWHIHSAIGRGRPLSCKPRSAIVSSRHYLHTTSPLDQDRIAERSKPSTSRAQRLQEATSSIENLYIRSAAHDNSIYKPTVLDSRHIGAPLSRNAIEGQRRAPSSNSGSFTMGRQQRAGTPASGDVRQSVVDARSLGARPDGAQRFRLNRSVGAGTPAGPEDNQLSVDARSLGARPEGTQGPLLIRKVFKDAPMIQQHPSREGPARFAGAQGDGIAGQANQTRFPRDRSSYQSGTPRGEGNPSQPGRSRAVRSQASRNGDHFEPRRRRRGAERDSGGNTRRGPKVEVWTEEEQQYLKEKAERKAPKQLAYEPAEYSRETFTGMVPPTASGEWGMSEMLGERLLLARKHLDGEFIQWDSKEQKADVMAVVEKLKAVRGGGRSIETASSTTENGDQQAQSLMQKLFAGEYTKFKRLGGNDVLGHVEQHVQRNDSFYPDDERSLLEKVKSILPAQQASKVGRGTRNELKA